jgi:hypothetical protein
VKEMETKHEVSINAARINVIGAYAMNDIIRRVDTDEDKVALVDLWTAAVAMRRELQTLRHLVAALPRDNDLPY